MKQEFAYSVYKKRGGVKLFGRGKPPNVNEKYIRDGECPEMMQLQKVCGSCMWHKAATYNLNNFFALL